MHHHEGHIWLYGSVTGGVEIGSELQYQMLVVCWRSETRIMLTVCACVCFSFFNFVLDFVCFVCFCFLWVFFGGGGPIYPHHFTPLSTLFVPGFSFTFQLTSSTYIFPGFPFSYFLSFFSLANSNKETPRQLKMNLLCQLQFTNTNQTCESNFKNSNYNFIGTTKHVNMKKITLKSFDFYIRKWTYNLPISNTTEYKPPNGPKRKCNLMDDGLQCIAEGNISPKKWALTAI